MTWTNNFSATKNRFHYLKNILIDMHDLRIKNNPLKRTVGDLSSVGTFLWHFLLCFHFTLDPRTFLFLFFLLRWSLALSPGWVQVQILVHCTLHHPGSSDFPASASWIAGTTGVHHHTQIIFVFLVETGFHHVGYNGLNLLTSWSSCLSLPQDYRHEPLPSAYFYSSN